MSSEENPGGEGSRMGERLSALKDKVPPPVDEEPVEPVEPEEEEEAEQSAEDAWAEDYDEHIDGEEIPPPKPRKKRRRYGGLIVLVIIIIFLVVWTVYSPDVLPQSGGTYLHSQRYASLSGFSGEVDSWMGDSTWALSVGGPDTATVGTVLNLSVLVSKVSENTSSWWFTGTGISYKNVSVFLADGSLAGIMSNKSDLGFGLLATVPLSFSERGFYELYVYVKFVIYADMRIGFLPAKAVEMQSEHFTIHVT